MANPDEVLRVEDLRLVFRTPRGDVQALRGVDLTVKRGRILGVVGESGSGKTMIGRSIIGLLPQSASLSGRIVLDGIDLVALSKTELARLRGSRISMIFQDPSAALNPVFTVGQQLGLILKRHGVVARKLVWSRAGELLATVGLPNPRSLLDAYPHQLSGGMQQRAMIAMAIATHPDLLIADEPTTALDVTIQQQILELLCRLRDTQGLTVMLITHNMAVVAQACQDVAVVYAGRTVEQGGAQQVLKSPKHPYTEALLATQPKLGQHQERLNVIPGSVPTGLAQIVGCSFAPRCERVMPACRSQLPPTVAAGDQDVACLLYPSTAITTTPT